MNDYDDMICILVMRSISLLTLDFRGFDSSIILMLRGGVPRPIGNFPESLTQTILVGITLVGRLGVLFTISIVIITIATIVRRSAAPRSPSWSTAGRGDNNNHDSMHDNHNDDTNS